MRSIILIALRVALVASGSLAPALAQEVVSKANFYAETSDGECGLEFTIEYRNRPIKGSIAFTDLGLRLRLPEKGFVLVNGKVTENESEVFGAMAAQKGLAVGFYDGTILPIDLTGLDPKPFVACVVYLSGAGAKEFSSRNNSALERMRDEPRCKGRVICSRPCRARHLFS